MVDFQQQDALGPAQQQAAVELVSDPEADGDPASGGMRESAPFRMARFVAGGLLWCVQSLLGIASLVLLLAVIAAVPLLNFVALGYLLDVEGRVGRSGKFRDAFPLIRLAPRLGAIAIGVWLWLLPLRVVRGIVVDAELIDPEAASIGRWRFVLSVLSVAIFVHLCLALARGGSLSCFFRPIKNARWLRSQFRRGGYWSRAEEKIDSFVAGLRLRYHFWLGLRGFIGGFAWLFVPTFLFAAAKTTKGLPVLVTLFGGFLLVLVLSWLPFLQARFAVENRLRSMFELRAIRRLFRHAPLAWLAAVVVTFALSLPLYLLTIALPPRDAMWLATILFIVTIYPARVLVGWAYHQAICRTRPAWFGWRWLSGTLMVSALTVYVFLLFFTQSIGQHGKLVLFEHHALLLPVPF